MVFERSTEEWYRFKHFSIIPFASFFPPPPPPPFPPPNYPFDFITNRCNRKQRKKRVRRVYSLRGDKITTMILSLNNTTLFRIIIVIVLHRFDQNIRFIFDTGMNEISPIEVRSMSIKCSIELGVNEWARGAIFPRNRGGWGWVGGWRGKEAKDGHLSRLIEITLCLHFTLDKSIGRT